MTAKIGGGLSALLLLLATAPLHADTLLATRLDDGRVIARLDVPQGGEWCVLWNHSVQGFPVVDCYENRDGQMVLTRSRQPDFAAGLGHIPGRGEQVSDGEGGYWILGIDEPVPGNAYILRPGAGPVDHRLSIGDETVSLSAAAPRQRVRIELRGE